MIMDIENQGMGPCWGKVLTPKSVLLEYLNNNNNNNVSLYSLYNNRMLVIGVFVYYKISVYYKILFHSFCDELHKIIILNCD